MDTTSSSLRDSGGRTAAGCASNGLQAMRRSSPGSTSSSRPVSAGSTGSASEVLQQGLPPAGLPPSPLTPTSASSATAGIVVVTVVKDAWGYGMKVSGDNPVYVQSVKSGGQAELAGLKTGDKILKVNGILVTESTHIEVVELIRADTQVVLTVQQRVKPPLPSTMPASPPGGASGGSSRGHHLHHHHVSAPGLGKRTDSITGPQPVDLEKKRQLEKQRKYTFRLMLEKEQRYVETLRSELAKINEPRLAQELAKAERRMRTLQEQLLSLESPAVGGGAPEFYHPAYPHPAYFSVGTASPPPLPPSRPRTLPPHPTSPGSPPALPPRNPVPLASTPTPSPDAAWTDLNINEKPVGTLSPPTNRYANSSPTHQRAKSSPDPLGTRTASTSDARASLLSGSESEQDLNHREKTRSWDMDSPRVTPPGTPPPPYKGGNLYTVSDLGSPNNHDKNGADECGASSPDTGHSSYSGFSPVGVTSILTMEDDEMSDQEMSQLEDHGPFNSLSRLRQHSAHLAVFMNYLLCNVDPSSLLFFLVTDLYKEGNVKEMKKWAYEIHSSFLVPGAPLRLNNVDENVAREVDEVLLLEADKEEILRRVFWKARSKAKEELTEQLADFRLKRVAGLGTLFGPPDAQLEESIHDKNKEARIIETHLLPKVESCHLDFERESDGRKEGDVRKGTQSAAVCTVMSKVFNVRNSQFTSLMERVPTFVSKDKSLKLRLLGRSRKVTIQGHQLVAHQYFAVTYCNNCGLIIGGIGPQGYQCTSCLLNIHRWCVRTLEESCAGPLTKKDKGNDRISKLMEKIRPEREARRKPSHFHLSHNDKTKKNSEEKDDLGMQMDADGGDRPSTAGRRPDALREGEERSDGSMDHNHLDAGAPAQPPLPSLGNRKPSATSINRSESYKERVHKRQLRERRKTSDPNLSKSNDVDLDGSGLQYNNNSGSSSNSTQSLRSLDSPSNSLEMVTGVATRVPEPPPPPLLVGVPSAGGGGEAMLDSDMEAEPDPPDWTRAVGEGELKQLSPKEKKRQEVINELFHTERSHVRALKVLDQIFFRPLLDAHILPFEQVMLLFPNLTEMLEIHSSFNNAMKTRRLETPLVGDISDLLLNMFDGPAGENFQQAAATFCSNQQIALEALKERRRKDQKLNNFLTEAEGYPVCRRLQLKDIIPTGMLRLTKYPLLFENLAKLSAPGSPEKAGVQRALERSKEILNYVNQAVREAEDQHRLADLQRRLDKSSFDKADHPMANEFKNFDLTKHKMVYEGSLNWRLSKGQKPMDLHVVLLEGLIVLLLKQDDKFVLKFHTGAGRGEDSKFTHSPIIRFSTVLVRPVATDSRAFFLVNTSSGGAHIYELVALSSSERKIWFKHISEAADAYKMRESRTRRPDVIPAAIPLSPSDNNTTSGPSEPADKEQEAAQGEQAAAAAPAAPSTPAPTAPDNVDSDFQAGNADAGASLPAGQAEGSLDDASSKKTGTSPATSPSVIRRSSSRVGAPEVTRMTEETPLIQPSEVVVCKRDVLLAKPVLTPIERLRREDEAIAQALRRKQEIVAEILHIPKDQYDTIAELASEPTPEKEASELALACFHQASRLTTLLNESLRVSEEEAVSAGASPSSPRPGRHRGTTRVPAVPTHLLQDMCLALNGHITQIMKVAKERDDERELLRRETQRLKEQVHAMHEQRRTQQSSTRPRRRATASGMSTLAFPTTEQGSSTSGDNPTEDVDDESQEQSRPPDTEPSQEEFVDALCGEGEGSLDAEEESVEGRARPTSPSE